MHVAHVVSSLGIGGQERVVLDLARGIASRGHRASVVTLSEGGALRPRFEGIAVISVPRRDGLDPMLALRLAGVLRTLAPDVVHTHNPAALTYGAPAAALAGIRRLVHTKHGANPAPRAVTRIARALLARRCDAFVAVSGPTAEVARRVERVPDLRLSVIPNGIDVAAYARSARERSVIRAELGIGRDDCVLGTVGRLAKEKDQVSLVRAAAPLLGPRVRLVIVGQGPERRAIEEAIPAEVRRFVVLTGARGDVRALLSAFDVFVLSSSSEGLPLVVPEAMAASLPVIATAVGGLPEVVRDGVVGRLVPPGDVGALRRAMAELAASGELRRRHGAAALADARERFALDRVLDAYELLYRA